MCEYCEKHDKVLYQTSRYGNLYIDWMGENPLLTIYPSKCPQFANCAARDMEIGIAYKINYCPECGARLKQ